MNKGCKMNYDVDNFYIKMLKQNMEQYLYWQIEANENLLNGNFESICAENFMVERKHSMALYAQKLEHKLTEEDFNKMYLEASECARKRHLEENNTIFAKIDK